MASVTTRKQAPRLPRPAARYWKGKAPKGVAQVSSDSELEEEDAQSKDVEDIPITSHEAEDEDEDLPLRTEMNQVPKGIEISFQDVKRELKEDLHEEEDEEEEEEESEEVSEGEAQAVGEAESEESGEDESDSEEEKPQLQFRPVFVPKRGRATLSEIENAAQDADQAMLQELKAMERKKQSHDLVAESIKRELTEKEKENIIPECDDTDGLDPAGEFEAWRLRELSRIKNEKEQQASREREREEIERRRALPEAQRLKEDLENAQKTRDAKPKTKQKFLQKYFHKGAFHQDLEVVKERDYNESTESTIDVTLLPKVMQVRDFGKRSRTKWTHLRDQDTTEGTGGFGGVPPVKLGGKSVESPGTGCFLCGGPHLKRDCPQNTGPRRLDRDDPTQGASGPVSGSRQWGSSWRSDREADRDVDRHREKDPDHPPSRHRDKDFRSNRDFSVRRDRWRSRSRSPDYDKGRRRSRSRSRSRTRRHTDRRRSQERDFEPSGRDRDKRRRIDVH